MENRSMHEAASRTESLTSDSELPFDTAYPGYKIDYSTLSLVADLNGNRKPVNPNLTITRGLLCYYCRSMVEQHEGLSQYDARDKPLSTGDRVSTLTEESYLRESLSSDKKHTSRDAREKYVDKWISSEDEPGASSLHWRIGYKRFYALDDEERNALGQDIEDNSASGKGGGDGSPVEDDRFSAHSEDEDVSGVFNDVPPLLNVGRGLPFYYASFGPWPYHQDQDSWKQAILRGCHLCTMLWSHLARNQQGVPLSMYPLSIAWHRGKVRLNHGDMHLKTWVQVNVGGDPEHCYHPDKVDNIAVHDASNSSKHSLEQAKSFLHSCVSQHSCGKEFMDSRTIPTRLIEINQTKDLNLSLVYPERSVQYCAVSHCWGQAETLKLTYANHDDLTHGIGFHLPQLYLDCIRVAQHLEIEYIWIDSLCIIQDSKDDWIFEASRMGNIYQNSFCTIAAVSASDANESLFTKTSLLKGSKLIATASDGLGHCFWTSRHLNAPLYDRAWVVQERLLSPRILEFTEEGIDFNCLAMRDETSGKSCNEWVGPYKPVDHMQYSWQFILSMDFKSPENWTDDHRKDHQVIMWQLLRAYQLKNLTYDTDLPHAFEGLRSILAATTGVNIKAWTCEELLPWPLIWGGRRSCTAERYSEMGLPSWSCLYTTLKYKYDYHWGTPCSKAAFRSHPSSKYPRLWVRGRLIRVLDLRPNGKVDKGGRFTGPGLINDEVIFDICWNQPTLEGPGKFELVAIILTRHARPFMWEIYGVVLKRKETVPGIWERAGMFVARRHEQDWTPKRGFLKHYPDIKEYLVD